MSFISNTYLQYSLNNLSILLYISSSERLLIHTGYWYLIFLSIQAIIGILFTNMMYIKSFRFLCFSISLSGIFTTSYLTVIILHLVLLIFSVKIPGPKILSANFTLSTVTGQLLMILFLKRCL